MDDILSGLNEKQLEAVTSTEGYLRVIAGAGSGKTKLLVSRYAYLVSEYGIAPANILCVTFTNKAAGEMKRRIRALIGGEYDTSLISTYHGFCVRVLREDIEKVFYPKDFTIIDDKQQKSILGEIYRKLELKLDHASFEKILDLISEYKAKNRGYVARMCARDGGAIMPEITSQNDRIIEEYMLRQRQRYAMDFSDLLYFTLDIFARCPEVLLKWQDRLNYIQVDEYQDSSSVETELIDLLSAKYRNLMIVGDPDQNIYEWRGSDVRLLVDFDKTHSPTKTVILDQNYRSTPEILRCANTLIEKNVLRLKKNLFTKTGSGEAVVHYHSKSEFEEAGRIVENIEAIRRVAGCGYGSFAVLYRSGFLSRVVEKKFTESAIPYEIFGGVKFYRRMEIQDIMAYLRLVALDENDALCRIINTPRRRFGRTRLERLKQLAGDGSLYDALRQNIDDPAFAGSGAADFVAIIDSLRSFYPESRISEVVERVCAVSGYEQYIRELGDMERFDNLSEFKRIAAEYEKSFGEDLTLCDFISQIALQAADSSDDDDGGDTVKLMTIHAAKGLEFPYVFVLGMSEGIFPSSKSIEARRELGLEEERRLCYVAVTRAERRLFLLDSEGTTASGRTKLPSRFLFEMGEENYTRIGMIPKELREASDKYAAEGESSEPSLLPSVGDTISHPAFGEGVVLSYNEKKLSFRVRFDKLGQTRDIAVGFFTRKREKPEAAGEAETKADPGVPEVTAAEPINPAAERVNPAAEPINPAAEHVNSAAEPINPATERVNSAADAVRLALARAEEAARRAAEDAAQNRARRLEESTRRAEVMRRTEEFLRSVAESRAGGVMPDAASQSAAPPETPEPVQQAIDFDAPVPWEELLGAADSAGYSGAYGSDGDDFDDDDDEEIRDGDGGSVSDGSEEYFFIPLSDLPQPSPGAPQARHLDTRDCRNLWDDPNVPKSGWVCTGVSDLGAPVGVCEMCGHQIIRYVHHMTHPHYRPLGVGCVCAGKMEGDIERARRREASFKNRESRRANFLKRKWKRSRNNNEYLKIKDHIIVLVEDRSRHVWRYSFDSTFCRETFPDRRSAVLAVFEELERQV